MRRMLFLILFELKKILNRKKALLFLLALNIVPLVASLALIVAYVKFKGFGFGEVQFSVLHEIVKGLFTAHLLFAFIAPFFWRWWSATVLNRTQSWLHENAFVDAGQALAVITAKTLAIMLFLLLAVCLGGFFLQADLLVARSLTQVRCAAC